MAAAAFLLPRRELAYDHPSTKTAALGCHALSQYACFNNSNNLIGHFSAGPDAGDCCAMCRSNTMCVSFNHGTCMAQDKRCTSGAQHYCELFKTIGPTQQFYDEVGCVSGTSPLGALPGSLVTKSPPPSRGDRPNIVWLVVESTDGRTWTPGYQNDVVPLPNIRKLQQHGVEFRRHYANAPVCCPSRATFWSGRHASNLPHEQASSGLPVDGAWNNFGTHMRELEPKPKPDLEPDGARVSSHSQLLCAF